VREDIARATSDAMGEAAFGYQLNSQRNNSPSSIYHIFADVIGGGINLFESIPIVRNFMQGYKRRIAATKTLNSEVVTILNKKVQKKEQEGQRESAEIRDLLDLMMDSQNEDGAVLNNEELCNHTKTFLLAGYETTSTCVLWTMYTLAEYTTIQEKLAEEIIRVIGKDRKPTVDDLDKMPYLSKVIRESLRYRPPIPFVSRHVAEDVTLCDYLLPKGTQLIVNIYHQHHYSPVWVNPEKFDPDRWETNEETDTNALLGSYIPFLLGARNCIGSKFAMLEVSVMLAMILQKLRFEREPGVPEVTARMRISLVPHEQIRLLFFARN